MTKLASYHSGRIDENKVGPAMRKLNPRQRSFVDYIVTNGTNNAATAAREAGYPDNGTASIRVQGYRLAHNPDIIAAIAEESKRRLDFSLPQFIHTIIGIATDPTHKDQLKAAITGAGMAGVAAVTKSTQEVTHRIELSPREQIEHELSLVSPDIAENFRKTFPMLAAPMKDITPEYDPDAEF